MKVIQNLPLFAVLLVLYNVIIGISLYVSSGTILLDKNIHQFILPSGQPWSPTYRDLLIVIGLAVLYVEILKSTRTSTSTVVEHTFSLFIFIFYLIEFLMVRFVADSGFLILAFMSLIDVIAGFTITISTARRDFSVTSGS